MAVKWSEDKIQKAVDLWGEGKTLKYIGEIVNMTREAVSGFVCRNRDIFPMRVVKGSPHVNKKILVVGPLTVKIEDPPKEIPLPENALNIPWVELNSDQCQWSMDTDFFVESSNKFPCCGLPVEGGKGIRRRFCSHHVKFGLKGWEDECSNA